MTMTGPEPGTQLNTHTLREREREVLRTNYHLLKCKKCSLVIPKPFMKIAKKVPANPRSHPY